MSAEATGQSDTYEIPDEYDDVDPVMIPLLEQPQEWFQELVSCYGTAFGPFGDIVDLTPDAVVFRAGVYGEPTDYRQELKSEWEQSVAEQERIDGRVAVLYRDEAESENNPTVWVNEFGRQLEIYERVPFESRVTTFEELKCEIDSLIDHGNPFWNEMFEDARELAVENGLISPVDTLSEDQYHTTLQVLEIGRDDVDQLTDDEKAVLNEAHCIIQEMQELSDH